jgi:hypothetical protein
MGITYTKINNQIFLQGIYQGQTNPVILGIEQTSWNAAGHFIGIKRGPDYINLNAFFDIPPRNETIEDGTSLIGGYVTAGQIQIDGVSFPLKKGQPFFPPKHNIKSRFEFGNSYWWLDVLQSDTVIDQAGDAFFPFRAMDFNPGITITDLTTFPQEFGNVTYITTPGTFRNNSETLVPSLSGRYSLASAPTSSGIYKAGEILKLMQNNLTDDDKIGEITDLNTQGLNAVFNQISQDLNTMGWPLSGNFMLQQFTYIKDNGFKTGLIIRGTFDDENEIIYSVLSSNNYFFYKKFNNNGFDDLTIAQFLNNYFSKPVNWGTKMNAAIDFSGFEDLHFKTLINVSGVTNFPSFQRAGNSMLIRGTYSDDDVEEIIFILIPQQQQGNFDVYNFDMEIYEEQSNDTADVLNIFKNYDINISNPVPFTFSFDDLNQYFISAGINNLQLDKTQQHWLRLILRPHFCVDRTTNDEKSMIVYDGFQLELSRQYNPQSQSWGDIAISFSGVSNEDYRKMLLVQLLEDFYSNMADPPKVYKGNRIF